MKKKPINRRKPNTKKEPLERLIYSKTDIQELLGAGSNTVVKFLNRENDPIPHFRIGNRLVIPCDLFHQWLNRQPDSEFGND